MCVGLHPTEEVGLFGTVCGKWFAMDLETKEVLTMHPDSKEQYDCAAYSPGMNSFCYNVPSISEEAFLEAACE